MNLFPKKLASPAFHKLSRKRKIFVSVCLTHSFNCGSWDGGSKDDDALYDLSGTRVRHASTRPELYEMKPGIVVITTGYFRGKPSTPHIRCHPDDLGAVFGKPEMTDAGIMLDWMEEQGIDTGYMRHQVQKLQGVTNE